MIKNNEHTKILYLRNIRTLDNQCPAVATAAASCYTHFAAL
jgi:hypothetical protein